MSPRNEIRESPLQEMPNGHALHTLLQRETHVPVSPAANALSEALLERYGDAVVGILYYGSCFRTGTEQDGILDIFIIVDDYSNVYPKPVTRLANKLLPPNVFYFELEYEDITVRTKYAVMTLDQFEHRTSARCFHTFFWARFAQPCALTFARDAEAHNRLIRALAVAIETFIVRTVPLLPETFDAGTLWTQGLSASYRTELRPEQPGAAARLVEKNLARYRTVTQLIAEKRPGTLQDLGPDSPQRYRADAPRFRQSLGRLAWRLRPIQGKLINLLRIIKAAFTFDGGVDYVLWKIERHSGVKVEATPMLRRHPLLTCWPVVWRLYRAGAFR